METLKTIDNLMSVLGVALIAFLLIGTLCGIVDSILKRFQKSKQEPTKKLRSFDQERQIANLEILTLLVVYVRTHPSQRFGQVLRNTGILQDVQVKDSKQAEWETPDYYINRILIHEEPQVILERMRKELDWQKKNP